MKKNILFTITLLFIIIVSLLFPLFENIYYKIFFNNKLKNLEIENCIISTSMNNGVTSKTYIKNNKSLTEYYYQNEIDNLHFFSDYNKRKIYSYDYDGISETLEMQEDNQYGKQKQYIETLLNDKNEKLKSIEKTNDFYIFKFTNKNTLDSSICFLNATTYLLEKYILYTCENNKITLIEYSYDFSNNIDDINFPDFE